MFSKEEAKKLRQEFWISFGKSFPRKWLLYNTKIKDLSLKFTFEKKYARVSIDIEHPNTAKRSEYFQKFVALKGLFETKLPDIIFDEHYVLDTYKEISTIYIQLEGVSIHNKATWQETMIFLKDHMDSFETFWWEYHDFISS